MSITDARRNFSKLLDRIERGERVIITRHAKPFAAFIPISDFRLLAQAEARRKKLPSR